MELSRDGALLEEVCHCAWALRDHSLTPLPVHALFPVCVAEDVISLLSIWLPAAMPVPTPACLTPVMDSSSETVSPKKLILQLLLVMGF